MRQFVLRLVVNAIALMAAGSVISGIQMTSGFWEVLGVATVFTLVNAFLRPVVTLLSLPFIFLTLGLFMLVVNAGMLMITDALSAGLAVDGFGSAFLGSLVISAVNLLAGGLVKDRKDD